MNILYITDQIGRSSGVSVWCVNLCEKLLESGNNVKLALQSLKCEDPYPVRDKGMLMTIGNAIEEIEDRRWDVVHINGIWNWPYHRVANIAYKCGVPIVWSPHGSLRPWAIRHKWWKKIVALALYQKKDLSRARLLHVTSRDEIEDIKGLGINVNVAVVPLGVDIVHEMSEIKKIKEASTGKTILFVGRLHPIKGVDSLIRAWAIMKGECGELVSGWKICIVGDSDYSGYKNELMDLTRALGVDHEVLFRGAVYGEEKELLYAGARVLILPSHSENFGAVVVEALANGTPVVATRGTPWSQLEERECGWWVDIGVDPLVKALKKVMTITGAEWREMGMRGRALVEEQYSWESVAEKILDEYNKILTV